MHDTHIGIFLHLVCLCFASASRLSWTWASKEPSEQRLLRIYPTSLEECLEACSNNDNCQGVIHKRLANLCDLHSQLEPLNEQSSFGNIVVHRSDLSKRGTDVPYFQKPTQSHEKVCSMTEFGGLRLFGNMNRAGSRLVVEYGADADECFLTMYTCAENGTWIKTGCKDESPCYSSSKYEKKLKEKRRDCGDVREPLLSGMYRIFPDYQSAVEVFCDFDDLDGPWTVIQRRVDGTTNFTRPFQSYVKGFGNRYGNFWLGLDAISAITLHTGKQYKLKVVIKDSVNGEGFAEYSLFKVMNAGKSYQLNIGGYNGTAGDSFGGHNGFFFSTYDNDRDTSTANCAELYLGGWWFHTCLGANLNGHYGDTRYATGIIWATVTGFSRSAIFATMKLKAKE